MVAAGATGRHVVSCRVDVDSDLVLSLSELTVVRSSAHTGDGAVDVVVHPPVTLVRRPLPHADLTWVSALGAAVTIGVAEHDVPFAVGGVAVDSEVIVVDDTEVSVVESLGELDVPFVKPAAFSAVFVVEHSVPDFANHLGGVLLDFKALAFGFVVDEAFVHALFVRVDLFQDVGGGVLQVGRSLFGGDQVLVDLDVEGSLVLAEGVPERAKLLVELIDELFMGLCERRLESGGFVDGNSVDLLDESGGLFGQVGDSDVEGLDSWDGVLCLGNACSDCGVGLLKLVQVRLEAGDGLGVLLVCPFDVIRGHAVKLVTVERGFSTTCVLKGRKKKKEDSK